MDPALTIFIHSPIEELNSFLNIMLRICILLFTQINKRATHQYPDWNISSLEAAPNLVQVIQSQRLIAQTNGALSTTNFLTVQSQLSNFEQNFLLPTKTFPQNNITGLPGLRKVLFISSRSIKKF